MLLPRFLGKFPAAIFQMHVPDAMLEAVQPCRHVAISRAKHIMPGVKNQSDGPRICELQKALDLIRSFYIASTVMVKDRFQPGGVLNRSSDRVCTLRESPPFC